MSDLREMMRIAATMRVSAKETDNERYIQMFLRTANLLEERASRIARSPDDICSLKEDLALHAPVNLLC